MNRPDALEMGRRSIAKHEAKMAAERQAAIDAAIATATAELRADIEQKAACAESDRKMINELRAERYRLRTACQQAETLLTRQMDEYNAHLTVIPRPKAEPGPILLALRAALQPASPAGRE